MRIDSSPILHSTKKDNLNTLANGKNKDSIDQSLVTLTIKDTNMM